ncbi:hypothetical protein ACHAXA_006320 [Cyclostephanos tholiformis]|uniref:SAM domain-containing protein n=1 Tax=Cyclostephanos tholiformis TaxID=382380 RepID=A0ABD3R6E8_9STRA
MGFKDFNEYSAEEISLWLIAQGLGEQSSKFLAEGVDGDFLLTLSADDLKNDLGLTSLQAKKLMKNIEFSKTIGASDEKGKEVDKLMREVNELEEKVQVLQHAVKAKDREIAELRNKISGMQVTETRSPAPPQPVPHSPAHAPKPAPTPAPAPMGRRVVGGAARGAAGGAVKGAIVGAILPGMDAADGAAAGAAVGAFGGGVGGLRGGRRR